jgi:signal peptidase II
VNKVESGRKTRLTPMVFAVAALVVVADQLTKWWATNELVDGDIDLVWTLRLRLVRNSGAAFSLAGGRGGIVALLAIGVVIILIVFGRAVDTRVGAVSLGLVLGGALGNILDRIFREGSGFLGGAVVDFIDLQWWPVFNVADAAVSIGGVLLVLVVARAT